MRVSLPENIVGRRAVLHFRRCHALAGAAELVTLSLDFSDASCMIPEFETS